MNKALLNSRENLIILDGDLVVNPHEFSSFLNYPQECLTYCKKESDEPVLIKISNNNAMKLNVNSSNYEWPGMVKIKRKNLKKGDNYIYDILNPNLPMKAIYVDAREVDTQDDYERVINWVNNNYQS